MTRANLERASGQALPVALLTATEGSIYGRFGFGEATRERSIEVDTGSGFALRSEPDRRVELIPTEQAGQMQVELFRAVHERTRGSVTRPEAYRFLVSGQWIWNYPEADPQVRAAAHYGPDGDVDGYVSYQAITGSGGEPAVHQVIDLLVLNSQAYLGLWGFLGSLDLSAKITWEHAPVADPLILGAERSAPLPGA